jgi:hypothetical protein
MLVWRGFCFYYKNMLQIEEKKCSPSCLSLLVERGYVVNMKGNGDSLRSARKKRKGRNMICCYGSKKACWLVQTVRKWKACGR